MAKELKEFQKYHRSTKPMAGECDRPKKDDPPLTKRASKRKSEKGKSKGKGKSQQDGEETGPKDPDKKGQDVVPQKSFSELEALVIRAMKEKGRMRYRVLETTWNQLLIP